MKVKMIITVLVLFIISLTGTYLSITNKSDKIESSYIESANGNIVVYKDDEVNTILKYSLIDNKEEDFIGNYRSEEIRIIQYIKDFKSYKFKQFGAEKFARSILFAHDKYNIDIDIMLALIKYESGFRPSIVHERTACIGATQINFKVWGETLINEGLIESKEDLFDITSNVICGAYVLSHYMEKHDNNIELALQRYYGKCNYALIYSDKVLKG